MAIKAEYQEILERLDELEQQEVIGAFDKRTIIELSGDVIKEIAQKYENVQKGARGPVDLCIARTGAERRRGDMMRGAMIETSARRILNQGINQGIKQGINQGIKQGIDQGINQGIKQGKSQGISQNQRETALRMLKRGKLTIEEIAEDTGLNVEEVEQLAGLQTV